MNGPKELTEKVGDDLGFNDDADNDADKNGSFPVSVVLLAASITGMYVNGVRVSKVSFECHPTAHPSVSLGCT